MKGLFANMWDNKESVVGGLFDMFNQTGMKKGVDNRVQGLIDMGVPEALFTKTPATTEANLGRSTANAIRNLPAQIPDLAKGIIDVAYNPIDTAKDLGNLAEGAATNFSDMFYDTLTPKKYEAAFKEVRDRGRTDQSFENEANASAIGQSILKGASTEQGRRDFAQGNSLDLLIGGGYAATKIPKLAAMNQNLKTPISAGLSTTNVETPQLDKLGYFSKAEQTVMNMQQNNMPKEQVAKYLENRAVSQAELKDLGIMDMLNKIPEGTKVTKQGLLDTIADNRVEFYGTSLTGNAGDSDTLTLTDMVGADRDFFQAEGTPTAGQYYEDQDTPDGTLVSKLTQDEGDKNMFLEEYMESFTGSYENKVANGRDLYPFNLESDNVVMQSGYRTPTKDYQHAEVMAAMHKLYPDKYPLTLGMQYKREIDRQVDLVDRNAQDVGGYSNAEKVSQEAQANIMAQLEINKENGIKEWDQNFLENYASENRIYNINDMSPEERQLEVDFEKAVDYVAEQDYLQNPVFLQKIPVEVMGETKYYEVIGTGSVNGYEVYNTDGQHMATVGDIPDAQSWINDDAVNRGFLTQPEDDFTIGETQYSNWMSDQAKKHIDSYSEELIRLELGEPTSVIGGSGYEYNQGHYGSSKNTMAHLRKTIRGGNKYPNTVIGLDGTNPEVYKIDEFQTDWHQDGRQFGYTDEEYKLNKIKHQNKERAFYDVKNELERIDPGEVGDFLEVIEEIPEDTLKAVENYRIRSEEGAKIWRDADGKPVDNSSINMTNSEFDEYWANSNRNPKSKNYDNDGYMFESYLDDIETYLEIYGSELRNYDSKLNLHTPTPRNPVKGDRIYHLAVTHAMQQAHKNGQRYIAWSNSDEVLDQWNSNKDLNSKGNPEYKELYMNIYDKGLPKAAEKLIKKFKGGKMHKAVIDGDENMVFEFTDEMIENIKKDFPNLPKDSPLPFSIYGNANQITGGLLQTDIAQPQLKGLIA